MKKWVVIMTDRNLLEINQEEFIFEDLGEVIDSEDTPELEPLVSIQNLEQIIDVKEIFGTSPREIAQKALLKFDRCVFLDIMDFEDFTQDYNNKKGWLENKFSVDQLFPYINVDELYDIDSILRKNFFINQS